MREPSGRLRALLNHTNVLLALVLGVTLAVLSALEISGSSVAVFNEYIYGPGHDDPNLLFGKPRWVRGDEWLVTTAMTSAQAEVGYAHFNTNVALGQEMSIFGDAPTDHWSTLFKPHNWSFFVLPLTNAVAFKWWFRGFLLIFATFLLSRELLKHQARRPALLALGTSLALYFTPFVQWWYSTSALESLTYFAFILYAFIKVFDGESLIMSSAHSLLIAFSLVALAFTLYPPFLIPLALLGGAFGAGYVANQRDRLNRTNARVYTASLAIAGSVSLSVILAYYLDFHAVLRTLQDTAYPGERYEAGGGFPVIHLMSGFFDFLLLRGDVVPPLLINQSEASSGLFFFPWLAPVLALSLFNMYRRRRALDYVLIALLAYCALMCTWLLAGLPRLIEAWLFLDRVPLNRAIIGLVMANFVLVTYFIGSFVPGDGPGLGRVRAAAIGAVLIVNLWLGYEMAGETPEFVGSDWNIWLVSASAAALVATLLFRKTSIFVAGLVLFTALTSLSVNPLYRGLEPLQQAPLLAELEPIRDGDPTARWVVYDDIYFGNYLLANGFPVLTSVQFYPQKELWLSLDPKRRYEDIWNRYAHVTFTGTADETAVGFVSHDYDYFAVVINPCNPLMDELRVTYYLLPAESAAPCLERVAPNLVAGPPLFVYRRVR